MEITWISNSFMMQYNRFEEALRQKLANAEMTPRPLVWEGIESRLPQPQEPNNRNKFIWISIVALVCLLTVLGGIYIQKPQSESFTANNTKKETTNTQPIIAEANVQNTDVNHTHENKSTAIQQTNKKQNPTSHKVLKTKQVQVNEIHNTNLVTNNTVVNTQNSNFQSSTKTSTTFTKIIPSQTNLEREGDIMKNESVLKGIEIGEAQTIIVDNSTIKEDKNPMIQSQAQIANSIPSKSTLFPSPNKTIQTISATPTSLKHTTENIEVERTFKKIKKGKQKRWEMYGSVGGNALVHNLSFQSTEGNLLSPFKLNTTGIIQLELVDSLAAVQVDNMMQFKDYIQTHDVQEMRIIESSYSQYVATGFSYRIKPYLGVEAGIRVHKQDFSTQTLGYNRYQTFYDMYKNREEAQRIGGLNYSTYIVETPFWINSYLPLGTSRVEGIFSLGATYRRWALDKRVSGFAKAARGTPNSSPDLLQLDTWTHNTSAFYRKHNFSLQARIGAQYHLTRNLSWFTAAHIQYLTHQMYKTTFSEKKPFILGLETGIRF